MTRTTTPAASPARRRIRPLWTVATVVAYVATAVGASLATDRLGLVPVGLGLYATAGTWLAGLALAGLALAARDGVHETAGRATV